MPSRLPPVWPRWTSSGTPAVPRILPSRDMAISSWHFLRLPSLLGRPDPPRWLFLGYALLKVLGECLQLSWLLLCVVRKPDVILVQNPPAIPTLLVALVMARVRRAKLVVDWHNFGYTMLALRLGQCHPVVRLARWYETRVVGMPMRTCACRRPCKRR